MSLRFPLPLAARCAASAAVALCLAGCERPSGPPTPSGDAAAPRCEVAPSLPGSAPWPDELRDAVGSAPLPARAVRDARRICNRLALEAGAFAQQHALDPIDWRTWSSATVDEARALDRPLLVLTGFAACGDCRKLAHETLGDEKLAAKINEKFVPVLVDHDERPDVDAYLMLATEVLTGGGGWPALVFLDSEARPFEAESWGAAAAEGRDFVRTVVEIARRLQLGGGTIPDRAEATVGKMAKRVEIDTDGPLPDAAQVASSLRDYVAAGFDANGGSFGRTPLFPRAPVLEFLLASRSPGKADEAREMAGFVLGKIRDSALADPVDGGFFRFARKPGWLDPSFEKLAADNAALASVYLDAAAATGSVQFGGTARATFDFLLRELRLPEGAFAAALEGTTRNDDGSLCDGCYHSLGDLSRVDLARSPEALERAAADRRRRARPARDERVLADANAVVISALARATAATGDARYKDAAVAAARFVDAKLRDGGRVFHFVEADGRRAADGYLADHALVATAFLDVAAVDPQGAWTDAARAIADEIVRRFADEGSGGFFQTGADASPLPLRFRPTLDAAVPSGNSAAARLFVRLAEVTKEDRYRALARRTVEAFTKILLLRPLAMPSMVLALEELEKLEAGREAPPPQAAVGPLALRIAPPQLEPAPAVHP